MEHPNQWPTREFPGVRSESPRVRRFPSYLPVTGLRVSSLDVSGQTPCDFCDSEFVRECVTARSVVCPVSVSSECEKNVCLSVYLFIPGCAASPPLPRLSRAVCGSRAPPELRTGLAASRCAGPSRSRDGPCSPHTGRPILNP